MFQASRPYFHQFSNGADVSVGLDFANMAEAQAFAKEVFVPVNFWPWEIWSLLGLFFFAIQPFIKDNCRYGRGQGGICYSVGLLNGHSLALFENSAL